MLHLHWCDEQFYLWGEQAFNPGALTDANSPFDPGVEALSKAWTDALKEAVAAEGVVAHLKLQLPTLDITSTRLPLPSQSFLLPEELRDLAASARPHMAPWSVTALKLPWKSLFALLGQIDDRKVAEGLFAAEDLIVFAELFRYAGALVARGRYLPGLRVGDAPPAPSFEAIWSPCIDSEEDARIRAFADRLPPSAFSESHLSTPATPPAAVLETILLDWVDRLVRASVVTTLSLAHALRGRCYSAHDAWFAALRGESRAIRWKEARELSQLAEQIRAWRFPVEGARQCATRPCFTLHTPSTAEACWLLEIGVDAGSGFRNPGFSPEASPEPRPVRRFIRSSLGEGGNLGVGGTLNPPLPEATLLALGQAAMLFPPLGKAEFTDGLHAAALTTVEAYLFLTAEHALLRSAGYDVTLPQDWNPGAERGFALSVDVTPHPGEKGAPDLSGADAPASPEEYAPEARVNIRHTVTFNGAPVSQEELTSLLDSEAPLVNFRGAWMVVDLKQIQQAIRIGKHDALDEVPAVQAVQLALGAQAKRHGLPIAEVHGHGWVETLFNRLSGDEHRFGVLPPPEGFCGELRPYQQRGFSWLVYLRSCGFGGCLADDMGLGKTIQALAFLVHEKERGEKRPALVAGPMSVLGNWLREAQRFTPGLRCHIHHGASRWHGESFAREMTQFDVIFTSYHLLYRDYADLRQVAWSGILLDEAQNIKNPETRQSQAARGLKADYRVALTGTPMENHVGDLWSVMDFLNPDMLGKRTAFREAFFRPIQTGSDPGARIRLKRMTAPFILRRLKTDKHIITDLPEKIEAKVYCPMTREQVRLYQDEMNAFHHELGAAEGIGRRGLILATLTRLKQICNHPEQYLGAQRKAELDELDDVMRPMTKGRKDRRALERIPSSDEELTRFAAASGKLTRLTEQLEEVFANNECALIFTQYATMGHLLVKHLCEVFGRDMPYLHGGVSRAQREQLVNDFQATRVPQAFVLSLKAGGLGLNLTRATHVFHYDRWWNPAVENQATDRAFRIGQTQRVLVHKFICNGTLEDRIDAMIESKSALAMEIIGHGENALTELSDEMLGSLLKLEADAAE
jgi:superfamily II DNA or RNA helicase